KEAARFQGEVKQRDQLPLYFRLQVNEHVAATDQIELGERRIADQILAGEDHRFTNALGHPIAVILAREEALQPLWRDVERDALGIHARSRDLERAIV